MIEVNPKIPDSDEAELRPAGEGSEPSAASRVFDERRLRAPLTPLPAREATGVLGTAQKRMKRDEKTLDHADDVIHGNWDLVEKADALPQRGWFPYDTTQQAFPIRAFLCYGRVAIQWSCSLLAIDTVCAFRPGNSMISLGV